MSKLEKIGRFYYYAVTVYKEHKLVYEIWNDKKTWYAYLNEEQSEIKDMQPSPPLSMEIFKPHDDQPAPEWKELCESFIDIIKKELEK